MFTIMRKCLGFEPVRVVEDDAFIFDTKEEANECLKKCFVNGEDINGQ